ncbi:terminase large subunit [Caulobacter sp. UC70_42]|uniref:terminase large subunit n=1 Tax=Caulobacter sp. UC70_42 TaxID=3374551 RepID=UPI0037584C91
MSNEIEYKNQRAERVIAFVEQLTVMIGDGTGQKLKLRPFQRDFIYKVYAPHSKITGKRVVRRAVYSVARKNGKTELAAALILCHLIGPESEPNGEIYSAANDRVQAGIVFKAIERFINAEPALRAVLKVVRGTKTVYVTRSDIKAAGSVFRALSSDAGRQHGLNPSLILYDELAQSRSRELFDTLATSQGARSEPLLMVTSTQNDDPTHVLSEMIDSADDDPTRVVALHSAPEGCDLMDEAAWLAANPALGEFRDRDELVAMAKEAVRLPSFEQQFRLLYLNQRVPLHSSLIAATDWRACGPTITDAPRFSLSDTWDFEPGEQVYLGLDMSLRTDLTALVAVSAGQQSRAKANFFKPEDHLRDHSDRDRQHYDIWRKQGWLTATPGRSVDPKWVAHRIREINDRNPVVGVAYDRAYIGELLRCLSDIGVVAQEGEGPGIRLVPWGQGFTSMGIAVNAFEHAVLQGELQHDGNPIQTWNVLNAVSVSDPAGNRKIDKTKVRMRVDGAVALAMALGLKSQDRQAGPERSLWDDPTFSLFGSNRAA